MTSLPFIFLLCFLSAEAARSKYPPKAAISSPVFGPRQVYGLIDGSVTVKCFYPPTKVNRHDRKYWCRESSRNCLTVVSSNGYMSPSYRGRASISDYPEQGVMVVNISQLVLSDRGTYQCGVGLNGRGLSYKVSLDISEGPNVPEEAELFYVELHGSVTMTCSFGVDTVSMRKYLCKMEKNICNNIIDTYGKIDEDFTGRALLSNENNDGAFSIMITQVNWEDAGLYVCGVGSYGEYGETKELDLHVYEGSNVPQGKSTVTGVKGGSVTIECHYDPAKNYSLKYLCKWRKNGCPRIIENTGFVSDAYEGRVAMFDNPQNGTFSVVLNQLRDNDKGYYWCMTNDERERKSSKELKVVEGEPGLKGKEDVLAEAGSRVDLTCSYPCKYYSYEKYWCKWSSDGCSPLSASDQSQPGVDVSCDTANKTLVLTFDSVTSADQGWYWCGVKRNGHYGETLAVYLQVAGGDAEKVAELSPELLNLDTLRNAVAPSDAVAPSNAAAPSNAVAPGDAAARSNAAAPSDAAAPSNAEAPSNAVAPGGAEAPSNAVAPSNAEAPSNAAAPSSADRGVVPQGRAFSDAGVQNAAASESSEQSSGSNALTVALASSGAAVVVLGAAFAVFKYRQLKRSDLVSVGSYRTNISMSDFESVKEYGANDNACMKASQETQLGGDEFITTTASVESAAETKKAKRSSKEDADLAYSTYLLTSNAIAQGCAPGDSTAPAAAPQAWDGQV